MPISFTLEYAVELKKRAVRQTLPDVFVQSDDRAHQVILHVTDGGAQTDLSGALGHMYMLRSDGAEVVAECVVSGSTVTASLPPACYAAAGRFDLIVRLAHGGALVTLLWLTGRVSGWADGSVVDPEDIVPSLDALLEKISATDAAASSANTAADNANAAAAHSVRYDEAQALTAAQQGMGRNNINAAEALTITTSAAPVASVSHPDYASAIFPVAYINAIQAGTGTPSPTNQRPISGFSAVNITQCGANLAKITEASGTLNGVTVTINANGTITLNGTAASAGSFVLNYNVKLPFNTPLYLSGGAANVLIGCSDNLSQTYYSNAAFTLLPTTLPLTLYLYFTSAGATFSNTVLSPNINLGASAQTFEPYLGAASAVSLPSGASPCFGGYIDWAAGKLVQTQFGVTVNGANAVFESAGQVTLYLSQAGNYEVPVLCDSYIGSLYTADDLHAFLYAAHGVRIIDRTHFTTQAAAAEYLTAHPAVIVYQLTTPIEYDITPPYITALAGISNLYHDGNGNIAATYNANALYMIESYGLTVANGKLCMYVAN